MTDPYESPATDPETKAAVGESDLKKILQEYLSFSGSFSRTELLIATAIVIVLYLARPVLLFLLPDSMSFWPYIISKYFLYALWGAALGKRSRDLGTTFTYGMVVGMIFPIIGLVFLFQEGAKHKASKRQGSARATKDIADASE